MMLWATLESSSLDLENIVICLMVKNVKCTGMYSNWNWYLNIANVAQQLNFMWCDNNFGIVAYQSKMYMEVWGKTMWKNELTSTQLIQGNSCQAIIIFLLLELNGIRRDFVVMFVLIQWINDPLLKLKQVSVLIKTQLSKQCVFAHNAHINGFCAYCPWRNNAISMHTSYEEGWSF